MSLRAQTPTLITTPEMDYPDDCTDKLPNEVWAYLNGYGILATEIRKYNITYSPSLDGIIYPVVSLDGVVLKWQARLLHPKNPKQKYLSSKMKYNLPYILGKDIDNTVILVEDFLSAIKVSRVCSAIPLFNAHIPLDLVLRLQDRFKMLGIWLDRDKQRDAAKAVCRASMYMPTFMVASDNDPKTYMTEEIRNYIAQAQSGILFPTELTKE